MATKLIVLMMRCHIFGGLSATLAILLLATFSSNASPILPERPRNPIAASHKILVLRPFSPRSGNNNNNNKTDTHEAFLPLLSIQPRYVPPETYLWANGWIMVVEHGPAILPVYQGAVILNEFYGKVMAIAAAHMLSNTAPVTGGVELSNGPLVMDYEVVNRAMGGLQWNIVYWFAAYMQMMARRGYTGLGTVRWRHNSGIAFDVALNIVGVPVSFTGVQGRS